MNQDSTITALTVGFALAGYLAMYLQRRVPEVRYRAYIMNLLGIGFCAVQILVLNPDPRLMAGLLMNFVIQNIYLASPYTWTPKQRSEPTKT